MWIFAITKNGVDECFITTSWKTMHDTHKSAENGELTIRFFLPLFVREKREYTYTERKENLRNTAIEYSNNQGELYGLSMYEISLIDNFFTTYGRRYGLLKEFKTNCII